MTETGDDELLVVRFEKEDNKKLYLEVFENYDGAVELATGAKFDIDWLCRTCQNNRLSVFAEKKDGMCRIYLYAFQRGNGGGDESLVQLEYEQVMMPQITLENYWSFRMGSDGTASVQSGTLKLNEINQVVGLWDYGQGTDQAEADYEETAGAPYESDSYPEAFIGMLEDFMGISRKPPDWYIRRNCRSIWGMIPLESMYLLMMCIAGKCSIQPRIFLRRTAIRYGLPHWTTICIMI